MKFISRSTDITPAKSIHPVTSVSLLLLELIARKAPKCLFS